MTAPVHALDVSLSAPDEIDDILRGASAVFGAKNTGRTSPQEVLAAALSDYRTLVQVLYDQGYFSPVVRITLDGREAAQIPLITPPSQVNAVRIDVTPGPAFRFGTARVAPLPTQTTLPEEFASGALATTGLIRDATAAGREAWRDGGHAKVAVGAQDISVNHANSELNADITLVPGPRLTFGTLRVTSPSGVRAPAIQRIAALPSGEIFSPAKVQKAGARLRRTGAFTSVAITEADQPNPDGSLDFQVAVEDQLPRRITFGAEISSRTGLDLSAIWIHRNLFRAAERLRIEGRVRNIGGDQEIDGLFSVRLDRPARLGGDNNLFYLGEIERIERPHYNMDRALIGIGIRRVSSQYRFAEAALTASIANASDAFGSRRFALVSLPMRAQFDRRDDRANPTRGAFAEATLTPFTGFGRNASGLGASIDARAYLSLTSSGSLVLAGRLQLGSVLGASLSDISPDLLFYSGGAGTVRGQPYQSLGIPVGTNTAGGRAMINASAELRARVTQRISLVGFYDFGAVEDANFVTSASDRHSGAGFGLRYNIDGFGPIRLDLALPVDGNTGDGLQFYIGIGQAF